MSFRLSLSLSLGDEPYKLPEGVLLQSVTVWMEKYTSCGQVITLQQLSS